ncbi:MAG: endonuclease/exonuclease/phosphatase family protein [Bacteroidota bacterium]
MNFSFRKFSKHIFITINTLVALAFCATSLQPFLDPQTFWFLGFFSLAFPYLFIILLVFIFFWLAANVRYTLISIVAMAICWKQIDVLFNVKQQDFKASKKSGDLRLMSWNVKSFRGMETEQKAQLRNAEKMLKLIEEINPDLVCFQEFGQYDSASEKRDYVKQLKEQGYKYFVLSKDYSRVKIGYTNGLAIFSKTPLIRTKRIPFANNQESILYADLLFNNDTIRVFAVHFQSFKFSGNDYRDLEKIKNPDDSLYEASLNIYSKMKRAFRTRARQAGVINPMLNESPYPEILACDMNDVPASYAYWKLKGGRKDAFAEMGFGVGRTFIALAPTLRIDYIMPNKRFAVNQFHIIQKRYSDHLPIVTDLTLQH